MSKALDVLAAVIVVLLIGAGCGVILACIAFVVWEMLWILFVLLGAILIVWAIARVLGQIEP